ncbi:hypothetical protein PR048_028237 [Dryococelus australis]|uniref:Uncharacterized protein n=1 Tax=Dryococelus australis TaxID=614101 RepID=A0ABQ9GIP6_9NEOP|nr:hypothetical protein PR048_028237 [Dryococelus australis]
MPKRDGKALLNFDLENIDNLSKVSSVDIGVIVKQLLKETKVSETEMQVFGFDCRKVLISVIEKKRKHSGVDRSILFGVASLDLKAIICEPTCGYNRMNKLIEALHEANQICDNVSESAKQQYRNLCVDAKSNLKSDFDKFETNVDVGLDEFFS